MTSQEIKSIVKMQDLFEKYGLIATGAGFYNCPFHSEKTGSMRIKNNKFKCYGCGEFGDVIDFIVKIENLSFSESINFLCSMFGFDNTIKLSAKRVAELNRIQKDKQAQAQLDTYNKRRFYDFYNWLCEAVPPKTIDDDFSRHYILKLHWVDTIIFMLRRMDKTNNIPNFDVWIKQIKF